MSGLDDARDALLVAVARHVVGPPCPSVVADALAVFHQERDHAATPPDEAPTDAVQDAFNRGLVIGRQLGWDACRIAAVAVCEEEAKRLERTSPLDEDHDAHYLEGRMGVAWWAALTIRALSLPDQPEPSPAATSNTADTYRSGWVSGRNAAVVACEGEGRLSSGALIRRLTPPEATP